MIITIAETIDNHVSWKTRALDDAVSKSESQKAIRSARKSLWFMVRFTSIWRCRVEFSFSGNHSTPWSKGSDPLAGTLETIEKWRKVETDTLRLRKSMWFMVKFKYWLERTWTEVSFGVLVQDLVSHCFPELTNRLVGWNPRTQSRNYKKGRGRYTLGKDKYVVQSSLFSHRDNGAWIKRTRSCYSTWHIWRRLRWNYTLTRHGG